MRISGYIENGLPMIGALAPDGRLARLTDPQSFYDDLPGWMDRARACREGQVGLADVVPAVPVAQTARVFCVGLNYRAHAEESAMAVEPYPTIFGRWAASLAPDGAPVALLDERLDWEGELAVIVGAPMSNVDEATANAGVFGYAPFNDISARTYQRHTSQWAVGKNMDGSGPIGAIVTADEAGRPEDGWRLRTFLNDETVQDGNTRDMIFGFGAVASYLSRVIALRPGDVIATGTPAGVGIGRTPPVYMKAGDRVTVDIEGIGSVSNPIVAAPVRAEAG